jgi:hypothetical protein
MKYEFYGLEKAKAVCRATAIVSPDGVVKWDNSEQGQKIETMLTGHEYPPLGEGVYSPIDITSYEDWKRVPYVICGSYFWCEGYYEDKEESENNTIKVNNG